MRKAVLVGLVLALGVARFALAAAEGPKTEEDLKREAAIAEFTRKMKEANYPALFEKAAQEFNVPADILKGVAFAETRWEHLMWPPGETESPETGMPRPYGIMSLWDNKYFGHSLVEAAALVGKTPEDLKQDAYQNIRGGAALLRKLYDETPKPEGTAEADIESWRYAIRKYCGIPEPDLNAQHALDVYIFMSRGYHQYGIEWEARPVNLEPIRAETKRIVAEEQARREAQAPPSSNTVNAPGPKMGPSTLTEKDIQSRKMTNRPALQPVPPAPAVPQPDKAAERRTWWFIGAAVAVLIAIYVFSRKQSK